MKILHLMLACFYIDNYNYQENVLPRINLRDGHNVKIIASTETFIDNINLGYIKPSRYINEDGIEVVRIPYKSLGCRKLETKVRKYAGLYEEIEKFQPQIIFCHGLQFKDLDEVIRYKKKNTGVKVFADSHSDIHNSALSFISKNILYKQFYNRIINRNLNYIEKVFCVSKEAIDFIHNICNVPREKTEYFPLGGIIEEERQYLNIRNTYRKKLYLNDDDIMLIHTGKMNRAKKTIELLNAFSNISGDKIKLILIGEFANDIKEKAMEIINSDNRIIYLGWQSPSELLSYLCASDIYAQPGTQSATMQNAACARNAMLLFPYESHKYLFGNKALYVTNESQIENTLRKLLSNKAFVEEVKEKCFAVAERKLDYNKLVQKYCE